ncbi:unnamed protein product [Hymenolepis diminuta]|uniref:Uncharacterized protein n=1 Tax=Hymenolepis diminuta TaxID=6216 RepID=A0A564YYL3_HYMDI|nr:unnamed protein product [Hymenolepis diminuta]
MFHETEPFVTVVVVPLIYPILDLRYLHIWLQQLENSFHLCNISKQKAMYQHAFSVLITDVATQVIDKVPKVSAYGTLKVLSLVVPLILRRNVYDNRSRKSN